MNPRKIRLYVDLFFCVVFLPLIITLIPVRKWLTSYPSFAIILICFLYILYFSIQIVNLPQKTLHKKWWPIIIFSAASAIIAYLVAHYPYPTEKLMTIQETHAAFCRRRIQTVWFLYLVVSGYSLSVSLLLELYRQISVKKELEEQKKNAELALYHAQINPHFFFNTMNTLYGLLISNSDKVKDAFLQFTDLLKYTYTIVNTDFITLKEEVQYINNYIKIQQLRLNEHTRVTFVSEIEDEDIRITPMLFISFIENSFKFGVSSTKESAIEISIRQKGENLEFYCINDIVSNNKEKEVLSVGIQNTRSRLEILYAGKYEFLSEEADGKFIVNLKMNLKK